MAEIHHFDLGIVTPAVSYTLSVLGSMLGLTCAIRLRTAESTGGRAWWLALSAVAIGGTAIWSMHFVAMMGFKVMGTPIRYDVGLTFASAIIAIVAVVLGMSIAALGGEGARNTRIVIGGVIAGLGVAAMHYTGMAAMRLNGDINYDTTRVGLSIGIAVVAAAVALWLAVTVQRPLVIFASALVMGVAVNGMHFTGMSAMSVNTHPAIGQPAGTTATNMIVPIGVTVIFAIIGLGYALMAAPTEEDRAAAAYLASRRGEPSTTSTRIPAPRTPQPAGFARSRSAQEGRSQQSGRPQEADRSQEFGRPSQGGLPQGGQSQSGQSQGGLPQQGGRSSSQTPPGRSTLGSASWTYRDRGNQ